MAFGKALPPVAMEAKDRGPGSGLFLSVIGRMGLFSDD